MVVVHRKDRGQGLFWVNNRLAPFLIFPERHVRISSRRINKERKAPQWEGRRLMAEVESDLAGPSETEDQDGNRGAGRGIQYVLAAHAQDLPCWTEVAVR